MNKGWKTFWVAMLVVFAIGAGMMVSGAVLGASVGDIRDEFQLGSLRVGSIRIPPTRIPSTRMIPIPFGLGDFGDEGDPAELSDEVARFSDVEQLELDISTLTVVVLEHDDAEVIVDSGRLSRDLRRRLTVNQSGNRLIIRNDERRVRNVSGLNLVANNQLVIHIPRDMVFTSAEISVGVGTLKVDHLSAVELSIDVGVGEAVFHSFDARSATVECGVGRVELNGSVEEQISINNGIGETVFRSTGRKSDHDLTLSSGIGAITVDGDSQGGFGNNSRINSGAEIKVTVENGIGSVDISFQEP